MSTGYSGKPLAEKLGVKTGMRVVTVNAPDNYAALLGPVADGIRFLRRPSTRVEFIHVFAGTLGALLKALPRCEPLLADEGMLWISWPKRGSRIVTDIAEADVRRLGLASGLVDVKVCAVDETWSGLKFVRRLRDRAANTH
jgi:hypothetical protein